MKGVLVVVLGLFASSAVAQEGFLDADLDEMFEMVRELLQSGRESVIAEELGMTSEERVAFWPVYDEYVADMDEINARLTGLILEYAEIWQDLPEETAVRMVDDYFEIEMDRLNVRTKYLRRFDDVLPPKKLARFVQLENKLNVLVELELAQAIPLIQ